METIFETGNVKKMRERIKELKRERKDLVAALNKIKNLNVKDSDSLWFNEAFLTLIERLQEVARDATKKYSGGVNE